jgi:ubiquinol-cytochrome c reductase iron-sulfur subunit
VTAPPQPPPGRQPPDEGPSRDRAELTVAAFLGLTTLAAVAAIVVYLVTDDTQLLGITFGLAFLGVAGALMVAGLRLYPAQKVVEDRPVAADEAAEAEVEGAVGEAAKGISRRGLLAGAAGAAGAALGGALVVPLGSLGPFELGEDYDDLPWRDGVRLVDDQGAPVPADLLEQGAFTTAFPEGADKRELASPVVVLRLGEGLDDLDAEQRAIAPRGILAFSRICTHAGCAIALYRTPLFPEQAPKPALVCPCHYSTFDVRQGGKVIFGPAGRDLPQLPLRIDDDGILVAAGPLSDKPGPSYLTVRKT